MQPDVRESSMQIRFEMKASCAHIPELSNGTIIAYCHACMTGQQYAYSSCLLYVYLHVEQ